MIHKSSQLKDRYPLHGDYSIEGEIKFQQLMNKQAEILKAGELLFPRVSRYFGSRLHDSWIISIKYTGNCLTLCLNDFPSHVFCDALVELTNIKIPHKQRQCPVSFTFENVHTCSLCRINKNDKVMPINKEKNFPKLTEYLWDEIHEISPQRIKMGVGLWADLPDRRRNDLILEIDAERLIIKEGQRDAILRMFNDEYIGFFDSYWQELDSTSHDYSTAMKFLKTRLNNNRTKSKKPII